MKADTTKSLGALNGDLVERYDRVAQAWHDGFMAALGCRP